MLLPRRNLTLYGFEPLIGRFATRRFSVKPLDLRAPNTVRPAQSRGAPSIASSSWGINTTASLRATIYSAYPPSIVMPVTKLLLQAENSPRRQAGHLKQWPPCQPTPTLCPTCQSLMSEPHLLIVPMTSCPGILGYVRPGKWPPLMIASP